MDHKKAAALYLSAALYRERVKRSCTFKDGRWRPEVRDILKSEMQLWGRGFETLESELLIVYRQVAEIALDYVVSTRDGVFGSEVLAHMDHLGSCGRDRIKDLRERGITLPEETVNVVASVATGIVEMMDEIKTGAH
jgi:hypothetical protein